MALLSELAVLALVIGGMCLYAATVRRLTRPSKAASDPRAGRVERTLIGVGLSLFGPGAGTTAALLARGSFELP